MLEDHPAFPQPPWLQKCPMSGLSGHSHACFYSISGYPDYRHNADENTGLVTPHLLPTSLSVCREQAELTQEQGPQVSSPWCIFRISSSSHYHADPTDVPAQPFPLQQRRLHHEQLGL